ncbi:hypothetical protein NK718_01940 [Alsobacter sp. SYSU M60028]|uniref:Uncharacterized protein n=1 Tax=Alsobacter ponti TaxID=2962936 RepID=A0ABT1LAI6_9HYPH|nr:hypothetical protein [Alsobacter ponti]MCP8937263.1 hypothetical protein [Alsobacter ponti]
MDTNHQARPIRGAEEPQRANVNEARQAVTGHNVRYVLFTALALLLVAFVILYFTVGTSWR